MELAILSDTHVPSRASSIPDPFRERIADADHVVHAGDFDSKGAIADVRDLATELTAAEGNMDPAVGLPAVTTVELGGVAFVVTHGAGSKRNHGERVANAVRQHGPDGAVGVTGHTHSVTDEVRDGVRLLNPGSATGAAPADRPTMYTATAADGDLDVTLHEL